MDHFPGSSWGRPRDDRLDMFSTFPLSGDRNPVPAGRDTFADGVQRTQQPIITGSSVLGVKYKDGVMLAADTLASYGSLARFKDIRRLFPVGEHTVLGASGDMSDFQYMQHQLTQLMISEFDADDGHVLTPTQIYEYIARVMYARRSKIDPLWNAYVLGGVEKGGRKFLGYVDLLGTTYSSPTIATGFGAYLAQPLLRKAVEGREDVIEEEEAKDIIENALRVLFYRDARSLNRFQIATVTEAGLTISEPRSVSSSWKFAEGIRGYGAQTQ